MKASLAPAALASTVIAAFLYAIGSCAERQLNTVTGEQISYGTVLTLTSSFPGGRDSHVFYLRQDDGQMYRLSFCSGVISAADLVPNVRFAITYSSIQDGVMNTCQKPRQLNREPPAAAGARRRSLFGSEITTPIRPTFLVYIVTVCGFDKPAAATPAMLNGSFFAEDRKQTLAGYYKTCSYGKVSLAPSRVLILANLTIPCTGELKNITFTFPSGNRFDTSSCGHDNLLKWHYYLDSVVSEQRVVPTDFNHKVILLPAGFSGTKPMCNGFAGTATVGPWIRRISDANLYGTGLIWWSGDHVGDLEIMFHEVGHTLGMAHAAAIANCKGTDQCDHTCPMGATGGQGIRCLNAPHLWQLGWGQPFRQLTDTDLPIGTKQVLTMPPQLTTSKSFVMVDLNTMPGNMKLYVAVRINTQPYELPYGVPLNGYAFLTVHSYNGTDKQPYARTVLLADIQIGDTYVDHTSGLVVSYTKWDDIDGVVLATFCRQAAATEQICGDGLDDDCDGLPDAKDPDCIGKMADGTNPFNDDGSGGNEASSYRVSSPPSTLAPTPSTLAPTPSTLAPATSYPRTRPRQNPQLSAESRFPPPPKSSPPKSRQPKPRSPSLSMPPRPTFRAPPSPPPRSPPRPKVWVKLLPSGARPSPPSPRKGQRPPPKPPSYRSPAAQA